MRCLMLGRVTPPNKGIPHIPQFQLHGCGVWQSVAAPLPPPPPPPAAHGQGCLVYSLCLWLTFAQFLLTVRSCASIKTPLSLHTIPSLISCSALLFCDRTFQHMWNSYRCELWCRKKKVRTTPFCGAMRERAENSEDATFQRKICIF